MKENCLHVVWAENGRVGLSNDSDGFYVQIFETRNEIDAFISELIEYRDKTLPINPDEQNEDNDKPLSEL